jgi:pimeloyl-ACP methyl ester carboxylesterase
VEPAALHIVEREPVEREALEREALEREATDTGAPGPGVSTVVLVHGVLDSRLSFDAVAAELTEYRIVSYDRRGWGESRGLEPARSLTDHADDLLAVIGERRVTVVAHSFGGAVALLATARRPDLVASLGLFEPTVMWAEWWPDMETQLEQAAKVRHHFSAGMEDRPRRTPEQRAADAATLTAELALVRVRHLDFAEIEVPCLLGHSVWTTPYHMESVRHLAEVLGADVVVIDDAGHTAHRTQPRAFAEFARRAVALGNASVPPADASD